MGPELHTLVETELYLWMLGRLAPVSRMDEILMDLTWAIARLADDLPFVEGSREIRFILSKPLLQDDGTVVRLMIRFLSRSPDAVELLTIESIPESI
jgi:hypothetical protein